MPFIEANGRKIEVDEEGYLKNPGDWDEGVARALAAQAGLGRELTPDRMDILIFIREYYKKYNFFPILRHVCKNVHQPSQCVTEKFMEPITAWKIAGLPNPGPELNLLKDWNPLGF